MPTTVTNRGIRFGLRALFVAVALVACAVFVYRLLPNDLSWAELQSIRPGMSEAEVVELLGRPDRVTAGGGGKSTWYYGSIIPDWVDFENGRVVEAVRF